jgi:hypothetical protein
MNGVGMLPILIRYRPITTGKTGSPDLLLLNDARKGTRKGHNNGWLDSLEVGSDLANKITAPGDYCY